MSLRFTYLLAVERLYHTLSYEYYSDACQDEVLLITIPPLNLRIKNVALCILINYIQLLLGSYDEYYNRGRC